MHVAPSRLEAVDTVYAMTIHKAQGSQFGTAAVLLPDRASRLLTRELLYTAITRAREELILAGTEEAVRAAVERPVARASGLRERCGARQGHDPMDRAARRSSGRGPSSEPVGAPRRDGALRAGGERRGGDGLQRAAGHARRRRS